VGVEGNLLVTRKDCRHDIGVLRRDALCSVHGGELSTFSIGMLGDFLALDLKLAFDEFVLGPDRDQLPGSHGEGTGKESGRTGEAAVLAPQPRE
jgi:hypothetical protein